MTATIKDVARRSGYSVSAVSQVLNNMAGARLSDTARGKIAKCAARLAYRPHPVALALKRRHGFAVSLILPDLSNPTFLNIAAGAQETLAAQGYEALIQHYGRDPEREMALLKQAVERRVEGVIILAMHEAKYYGQYACRLPLVCLSGLRHGAKDPRLDSVAFDLADGFCKATEYLIELGHTRIGLLNRRFDRLLISRRREGYIKALREHRIKLETDRIWEIDGFGAEAGHAFGRDHPEFMKGLTAILVYNDIMAIGLMKALREAGIKVPEDISIVGCDGIEWGLYSDPPLTTVCLPTWETGRAAAQMVLRRINGEGNEKTGRNIVLPAQLLVRKSSGNCKKTP